MSAIAVVAAPCDAKKLPPYMVGARPEVGSFLTHKATSLSEVIGQIRLDPIAADRMMRHFHMSKEEVIRYLSSLHQDTLSKDGAYLVYNVHDDGVIRARVFALKKGMKIYADATGKPVLRHVCANPMTLGPKRGATLDSVATGEDEPMKLAGEDEQSVSTSLVTVISEPEMPVPFAESTPVTPPSEPIEQVPIISSSPDLFGALSFGLLGSLGVIGSLSHSSNPPVPEPATALVLVVPLGLLALRRRNRG